MLLGRTPVLIINVMLSVLKEIKDVGHLLMSVVLSMLFDILDI